MRIVVVDPSRTVLKIVTRLLEAGEHETHPFTDGLAALEYIKSEPNVDALITSVELGSMSGTDLCKKIRQLSANRQPIYIVLMSANYEQRKLIEALDGGADDFIGKPPATEELYARLRAAERLGSMQRELVRLATTDPLSGLLNRRAFFERAQDACARADESLSAIMFDIDYFKRINDDFGHNIGDEVIRSVAHQAMTEKNGIIGRLGGEEFAIVLRSRTLSEAAKIAERLRTNFAELCIKTDNKAVRFTCSFGVSEWRADESIDDLLKRADLALYSAKKTGRNRVVADNATLPADDRERTSSVVRLAAR
jgi:two-component system, cell cycle response regulator